MPFTDRTPTRATRWVRRSRPAAAVAAVVVLSAAGCSVWPGPAGPPLPTESSTVPTSAAPTSTAPTSTAPTSTAPTSTAPSSTPAACPGPVPTDLGLDPFYDRYCDVLGIPLVADEVVDPEALVRADAALRAMLAHRPDIARALADGPVRVGVIGANQQTTDMPEWSDLDEAFPGTDWDARARGLGATAERPLVGAGEENLLCLPGDRYLGESIFVHEVSHTVLQLGAEQVDDGIRTRLVRAYDAAMAAGLWRDTYAATDPDEYWAEAAQSYFDTNLADDAQHNAVDTRAELERYDPAVHALLLEVFGPSPWRPTCP